MKYFEIHIGKVYDLESKNEKPKKIINITEEQLKIIERFADTRKDEDLNTIYKLNKVEFTVSPSLRVDNSKNLEGGAVYEQCEDDKVY